MNAPLIVTAELGPEDQAWFDALRRRHFPPERNVLAAHLTMFHQIPPSAEGELSGLLSTIVRQPRPLAFIAGLMDLGNGTAFRIRSSALVSIRNDIADHLHGMLSAQDNQGWRPHVTIQNKVDRKDAIALAKTMDGVRVGDAVAVKGLGLYRYRGGPWEMVRAYPFRG